MDEPEKTDQAVPAPTVKEEEMEVSMTTQLENLIVTTDNTNTPTTQTHAEGSDVHAAAAAGLVSGSVCKTDNSDEDSEDSDRSFTVFDPNFCGQLKELP